MANLLKSPWLRIGLLGLLIGVVALVLRGPGTDRGQSTIIITQADLVNVSVRFQRTWQRDPTDAELRRAVEQYVRQEVLYREALARGYDQDDPAVRLAMRQKMEFLAESQLEQRPPTDEEVDAFFALRREQYRTPAVLSFAQVYLSVDEDPDLARVRGAELLVELRADDPGPESLTDQGDPTMLPAWFAEVSSEEVERTFGGGFGAAVESLETGVWVGPVESGLGLHLVKVVERRESRIPEVAEVLSRVMTDMQYEAGQAAREQLYQEIAQNYRVVLDGHARELLESTPE